MSLSRPQQIDLLETAKSHWLEAQEHKHGYMREFTSSTRMSAYLKRGTFGAAVLTALATSLQSSITMWPGLVAAAATGVVSAFDQAFSPVQAAQEYWKSSNDLREILSDLTVFATSFDEYATPEHGRTPLKSIRSRLADITSRPIIITDEDKEQAVNDFERSQIHGILNRLMGQINFNENSEEPPTEMAYDANNVIAAARLSVGANR